MSMCATPAIIKKFFEAMSGCPKSNAVEDANGIFANNNQTPNQHKTHNSFYRETPLPLP